MTIGTLYGIGIGPGDPELITVKGARLLRECKHVFVPRAPLGEESLALAIARRHIPSDSRIKIFEFPLSRDESQLSQAWDRIARDLAAVLESGSDVCYLTLGDTLLYSTYVYLVQALRRVLPQVHVVTIPGITAFSAAAALSDFPIGAGDQTVTIVPASEDLASVDKALALGGTVVIMKIGKRLHQIVELLEARGHLEHAVFVARAGLEGERLETDLRKLHLEASSAGNLSVILVRTVSRSSA